MCRKEGGNLQGGPEEIRRVIRRAELENSLQKLRGNTTGGLVEAINRTASGLGSGIWTGVSFESRKFKEKKPSGTVGKGRKDDPSTKKRPTRVKGERKQYRKSTWHKMRRPP